MTEPVPAVEAHTAAGGAAELAPHVLHDDPLLSCLVEVTRLHGVPHSAQQLVAGLPLVQNRLTPVLLSRAAKRADFSSKILRRSLGSLPDSVLPAILLLEHNRACVLIEQDGDTALVHYPEMLEPTRVPLKELHDAYTGLAVFLKPSYRAEARAKEGIAALQGKHWFWATIFENWRLYRDAIGAALLINIFALVIPLYTMNVYDRVVPNNAVDTLWVLTIGIGLALLFNFVLTTVRSYVVDLASKRVDVKLSSLIMERVLDLRMEARPASVGSFASNLRSFESVRDFIASASLTTLVDLPFVLLFLAVLAWISPWMMLPPIVIMIIVVVVSYVAQRRMERLTKETFQASAQRNAGLVEALAGLETIKVLNAQSHTQRVWEQSTEHLAMLNSKIKFTSSSTVSFVQMMQQLVTIAVIIIGTFLIQDAKLSLGGIIASSMIAGRCLAPLGQVVGLMMQYQNARTSLDSIDNYMKLPAERTAGKNYVPRAHLQGDIELKDVSFAYPDTKSNVLQHINLHIASGEKVGIIGRIGSGKTTLSKLILGLYQPTQGTLLVDGIDSQQIDPADLRRTMGFVSQDPVLFYGTLKHNLSLGAPYATDEEILEAAKVAGVDQFASRHPDGYDMLISERGESLSGGQRQSIAVARAVLNNPSVLLLDEPSSNMDNQSEAQLRSRLKLLSADKTVILITHRTALLDLVDRLLVVDGGRIVADGPKEQVIEALRQGRIGSSQRGGA